MTPCLLTKANSTFTKIGNVTSPLNSSLATNWPSNQNQTSQGITLTLCILGLYPALPMVPRSPSFLASVMLSPFLPKVFAHVNPFCVSTASTVLFKIQPSAFLSKNASLAGFPFERLSVDLFSNTAFVGSFLAVSPPALTLCVALCAFCLPPHLV